MSDWKTIDSAPKDGTNFFAYSEGWDCPAVVYWYEYEIDPGGKEGYWCFTDVCVAEICGEATFTHWMPYTLPKI